MITPLFTIPCTLESWMSSIFLWKENTLVCMLLYAYFYLHDPISMFPSSQKYAICYRSTKQIITFPFLPFHANVKNWMSSKIIILENRLSEKNSPINILRSQCSHVHNPIRMLLSACSDPHASIRMLLSAWFYSRTNMKFVNRQQNQ